VFITFSGCTDSFRYRHNREQNASDTKGFRTWRHKNDSIIIGQQSNKNTDNADITNLIIIIIIIIIIS